MRRSERRTSGKDSGASGRFVRVSRLSRRLTGSIRAALQGRAVDAEVLQTGMRELNGKIRAELTKAGYPEDYLQPIYRCPICRDTGYVGEPVHELCACMKQRIMDAENAGEHKGGLVN